MTDDAPRPSRVTRWLWWVAAYALLGLAVAGIVLPLLPATPFAIAAARGSERLHARLTAHPALGPAIEDWGTERAIAPRAKAAALVMMTASGLLTWAVAPTFAAVTVSGVMLVMGGWIASRPTPGDRRTRLTA